MFRAVSRTSLFSRFVRRIYAEEVLAAAAFATLLLTLSVQALTAHEFKAGAIEIDHPWTRATRTVRASGPAIWCSRMRAPRRIVWSPQPLSWPSGWKSMKWR